MVQFHLGKIKWLSPSTYISNMFTPTRTFLHIRKTHLDSITYLSQEDVRSDFDFRIFRFQDLGFRGLGF